MQTGRGSRHHLLIDQYDAILDGKYRISSHIMGDFADSPSRLNANGISNVVGGQEHPPVGGAEGPYSFTCGL